MESPYAPTAASSHGLYSYIEESLREEERFHSLGFESLHRLNLVRLQNRLATLKSAAKSHILTEKDFGELTHTLHAYTVALRDYAYVKNQQSIPFDEMNARKLRLKRHFPESNQLPGRPLDSHYYYSDHGPHTTDSLRALLRRILPTSMTYSEEERLARQDEFLSHKPAHDISVTVDRLARLIVAFTGGIFLLVPMTIMVFHPSPTKSVVTTSAAVILFAVAAAFGIRATNVETMVSTATYAAVLVVFVGSNNNSAGT